MTNTVLLEGKLTEETGTFDLKLDQRIEINLSARQAQQKVNQFVHLEISTQLRAEPAVLVVSQTNESFWRVPVHLTLPAYGDVGQVGFIRVNPQTGDVDTSSATVLQLSEKADALARRFPSPAANTI